MFRPKIALKFGFLFLFLFGVGFLLWVPFFAQGASTQFPNTYFEGGVHDLNGSGNWVSDGWTVVEDPDAINGYAAHMDAGGVEKTLTWDFLGPTYYRGTGTVVFRMKQPLDVSARIFPAFLIYDASGNSLYRIKMDSGSNQVVLEYDGGQDEIGTWIADEYTENIYLEFDTAANQARAKYGSGSFGAWRAPQLGRSMASGISKLEFKGGQSDLPEAYVDFILFNAEPSPSYPSLSLVRPVFGEVLDGWPSHVVFDVNAPGPICGYMRASLDSPARQGQTEGACFNAGTTRYNYPIGWALEEGTYSGTIEFLTQGTAIASMDFRFTTFSDQIQVTGQGAGPVLPPVIGDTEDPDNPFYVDCSAYEGAPFFSSSTLPGIICGFKKAALSVAQTLFEPSQDVMSQYTALTLDSKFPFAYFYDMKDAFEGNAANDSGAFPSATVQMPSFTGGSAHAFTVFSSSTVSGILEPSQISLLRNLMEASIWLGLGYAIYQRTKNIFANMQ